MSTPPKLRATSPGQKPSEVTRFKELWRKHFSDEQKAEFIGWFSDASITLADIRARVKAQHGVNLKHDSQVSGDGALREWCLQELSNAVEAEWTASEEAELQRLGLKGEALRSALLDKIKARAYIRGDHKLGLSAVDRDLKAEELKFDKTKFEWNATREALAKLDTLKAIKTNSKLTEDQKLEQARLELFGVTPN